jgi:hypothetical protein
MSKSIEEILVESKAEIKLYFDAELDRYKLILAKFATKLISSVVKLLVSLFIGAIVLFFLFSSLAIYWGRIIENYSLGFLYTGLCALGFILFVLLISKFIIRRPIMRKILKQLFKDKTE